MKEALFLILGLVIGNLSGLLIMCMLQINYLKSEKYKAIQEIGGNKNEKQKY